MRKYSYLMLYLSYWSTFQCQSMSRLHHHWGSEKHICRSQFGKPSPHHPQAVEIYPRSPSWSWDHLVSFDFLHRQGRNEAHCQTRSFLMRNDLWHSSRNHRLKLSPTFSKNFCEQMSRSNLPSAYYYAMWIRCQLVLTVFGLHLMTAHSSLIAADCLVLELQSNLAMWVV